MGKNSFEYADGQQETRKAIYSFMGMVAGEAEQYAADHTSPMSPLLEEIENYTLNKTEYPSWLTGRVEGRFLQLIIVLSGFRNALWYGRIFEPEDEDSKAIALFNEEVNADNKVEKLFLTICDGIYLIRKKTT